MDHSLKCCDRGARIVVSGATSGPKATVDVRRVFAMQLEILGSSMGTPDELEALLAMCADGLRPVIDSEFGFSEVRDAFGRLYAGDVFGKVVVDHTR
jgi:D-arabinose 1-dehydrogenase-like Zn-dependent alcohol dehydrogenase